MEPFSIEANLVRKIINTEHLGYTTDEQVGKILKYHKFAKVYGWTPEEVDNLEWELVDALEIIIDEESKKEWV